MSLVKSFSEKIKKNQKKKLQRKNSILSIKNNIDELYSTIRDLLLDEKMITKMGKNAQNRALNEFTWEYISKKYLLLINKLIKVS